MPDTKTSASAGPKRTPDGLAGLIWERADTAWALAVTIGALALYAATLSGRPGLGDGPETVSGVRSLGILHAPGYPAYMLAARLWGTVAPFGDWAWRVNVFSAACAAIAIGLVFVLARQFGAARAAAALGALAVATSVSFWFNAGFAKHYAFSSLVVVLLAVLVVAWERTGGTGKLVAAGVVLGVGTGASWELTAIMAAGLAALVVFGSRRVTARELTAALGAALLVVVSLWVFVVVRAHQDPEINFGRPTTVGRLADLVRQKDFLSGDAAPSGVRALDEAPHRVSAYSTITVRELGLAAVALAVGGAVVVVRRRRWGDTAFLGIVLVGNVLGAVFVAGLEHDEGMHSGMVVGGFLIDLVVVGGVLVAIGTTALADAIAARAGDTRKTADRAAVVRNGVVVVAAVAVLLPSLLVHARYANHRVPDFANNYATRILDKLPRDAVIVSYGWEFAQPLRNRQIVHGDRPDVTVVTTTETRLPWYREEVQDRFPALAPPADTPHAQYVTRVIDAALAARRPVFVDMSIIGAVSEFGVTLDGDIAELTAEGGIRTREPLPQASESLHQQQEDSGWLTGIGARFPNRNIAINQIRACVLLAKAAVDAGDNEAAANQLRDAVRIRPDLTANRDALRLLEAGDPGAADAVFALTGGEE